MDEFEEVATAFVTMAHRIVWATTATVDQQNRPRSRILHPYWQWQGSSLVGWIATSPTPLKRRHLGSSPYVSITYWAPDHDTATAECRAEWVIDADARAEVWNMLKEAPPPVGYDPAIVPAWNDGPRSDNFAALRLLPWRIRVSPGTMLVGQGGSVLTWSSPRP